MLKDGILAAMKVLVTGGAGYIGSHTVVELVEAGMEPVIVDNFSNSNRKVLQRLATLTGRTIDCHEADVTDRVAMERIISQVQPEAVIHFAGSKAVGESMAQPLKYYRNNLLSTIALTEAMLQAGVERLVFSSTATVYGVPKTNPISEDALLNPVNVYGRTKLMAEQILGDVAVAQPGFRVTLLRYFNPVGAHPSGLIGEDSGDAPNNVMPYIAKVAVGKRPYLSVFGNDYQTSDGTGARDYLHVVDLARAHVRALQKQQPGVAVYNLGTGRAQTVLELVAAFERAMGKPLPYRIVPRRPGDIDIFFADPARAARELDWKAEKTLDDMCRDTWNFQSHNPNGYAA